MVYGIVPDFCFLVDLLSSVLFIIEGRVLASPASIVDLAVFP